MRRRRTRLAKSGYDPLRMSGYGIVGFGRIGSRLAARLAGVADAPPLVAILGRPSQAGIDKACASLDDFIARKPAIAFECASPAALAEYGPRLLAAGIDLTPLSLTALADEAVERRLVDAARKGPGRLEIAPGAVGSLDLLATAREEGLQRVVYRQVKPVALWKLTPAVRLADLDAIRGRTVFLKGSVRELAKHFPNNLNTSVGVALAGLGLDRTESELVADPALNETAHELDIHAAAGNATLRLAGREVLPDYTTFSLIHLLRRRYARVAT
jgi:aspartate dehydrogenase